jgi:hypothetical protein
LQVAAALPGAAQAFPHFPQFFTSLAASTSHPFTTLLSQSKNPATHVFVHWPLLQVVPAHLTPHPPQSCELVCTSTQLPLQQVSGGAHLAHDAPSVPGLPPIAAPPPDDASSPPLPPLDFPPVPGSTSSTPTKHAVNLNATSASPRAQ